MLQALLFALTCSFKNKISVTETRMAGEGVEEKGKGKGR